MPSPTAPRPSLSSRLAWIAASELAEGAILAAMLAVLVIALAFVLGATGAADAPLSALWSPERGAGPLAPRLLSALGVTAALAGGGLGIAAVAGTLLGWLSLLSPAVERLRGLATAASAIPLVAGAAVVQQWFGNHLLGPVLLVAATEMTLGTLAAQVRAEMRRELGRDYLDTARGAGRAAFGAYWRALAGIAIAAARPRIPHLLGATIVVERIFALEADGLADLVFTGLERRGDPAVLVWVAALGLAVARIARLLEALALALLDPRRETRAGAPRGAPPPSPWMPARPRHALNEALEAVAELPAALARLPRRLARALGARLRTYARADAWSMAGSAAWTAVTAAALALAALVISGWLPPEGSGRPRPYASPDWAVRSYLGTDAFGRDVLGEILRAGRNLAGPMALAVALPLMVGAASGALAACGPHRARRAVGRAVELIESLPRLVVLLAVLWVIPVDARYVWTVCAAIGMSFWPLCHAAVEDRVRRAASDGFLEAQRALGASAWRAYGIHALWRHGRTALAVQAASIAGHVLMMETTLAYLGYAQPDEDLATWGKLVAFGLAEPPPASGPWNPWARWAPIAVVSLACIAASHWADRAGAESEPRNGGAGPNG